MAEEEEEEKEEEDNSSENERLFDAVKAGDEELVKTLLQNKTQKLNLNSLNFKDNTRVFSKLDFVVLM